MNSFTKGLMALMFVVMACVGASADEVDVVVPPITEVKMAITAGSIEKVSHDDKSAFVVIRLPKVEFSTVMRLGRMEYKYVYFRSDNDVAAALCGYFGFGALYPMAPVNTASAGADMLAVLKDGALTFAHGSNYWTSIACAVK